MALSTRQINISLRLPTAQTSATVKFIPDLAAGDQQILLEETYAATVTASPASTTLSGSINLPVKAAGFVAYRVQFPRETGYNEHYIYVTSGGPIDLSDLLTTQEVIGVNLVLNDLHDVVVNAPTDGQFLAYDASTSVWTNAPGGVTGSGFANSLAVWSSANILTHDTALSYDFTNDDLTVDVAKIGAISGYAVFARSADYDSNSFALMQTNAETVLNAPAGSGIVVRIRKNNSSTYQWVYDGTYLVNEYDASNRFLLRARTAGGAEFTSFGTSKLFSFDADVTVADEVYGSGWNGSTQVPTKNAVYDKIETIIGLSDGDKGDITVSSSGTVWTIDAGAVTDSKLSTGINANKIANGSVDNTEFQYLDGVTSAIQTQLNAKAADSDVVKLTGNQTIAGLKSFTSDINVINVTSTPKVVYNRGDGSNVPVDTNGVGEILFSPYNSSFSGYQPSGYIAAVIDGTPGSNTPTKLVFGTSNTSSPLPRMTLQKNGNLTVGTSTDYSVRLISLSTTEQLRLMYNASSYLSTTVGSTGTVTLDAVGTGAKFVFSDAVEVPDEVYGSGWNGSVQVPTKNAVYDKIETIIGLSDGDKGDITVSSSGATWTIDNDVVGTAKLGGDITTAGKALLDDVDAAAQRTTLGLGTLATQNGTFSGTSSGTNTGDQTITLTGDVTGTGTGSFAATIANDAVTYAKMQNVSATDRILGRSSAGAGDVQEITCTSAGRALIDDADAAAQRTTLGLGTLATQNGTFSGTSSGTNTGDQNLFSTIAVSGQSNVVADSTSDTLTLIAGSNVTITTNSTNDEITIASSGGGGGLSDGDKGDITVSSSGTVWTIDAGVVTDTKLGTGINADKIADGTVSNTEFQYLNGVTSAIQTQIDGKFTLPSLTLGSVLFSNGTTLVQDNANLFWDDTNNRLGIGNAAPAVPLDVTGTAQISGTLGLDGTAATTTDSLKITKSSAVAYDGIDIAMTNTSTTSTVIVTPLRTSNTASGGGTTNFTSGGMLSSTGGSGTTIGQRLTGLEANATQPAGGLSGASAAVQGMRAVSASSGTITNLTACYGQVLTSGAGNAVTTGRLIHAQTLHLGGTMTTLRGLSFDGWNITGTAPTTTQLIYADTTTNTGTNKWGIYFEPDIPSYHVGKIGIGSGVTAPTARLEVRDTTEQVRVAYDASNYFSTTVGATGTITFDSIGTGTTKFVFSDAVEVPDSAYGSGWDGSVAVPTRNAVYDRMQDVALASVTFVIDGGGSAITTGVKGDIEIPFACTIEAVTLLADQSGSIVVDIWKDTYANYPPTSGDSITASAKPTISSAVKSQNTTLTGWTTSVTAGDTIRFNVDSATTVQRVTVSLKVRK
jgi:hypothetical protein